MNVAIFIDKLCGREGGNPTVREELLLISYCKLWNLE